MYDYTTKMVFKVRSIFLHAGSTRFIFGKYHNDLDCAWLP